MRATLYDESGAVVESFGDPRLNPIGSQKQIAVFISELAQTALWSANFSGQTPLQFKGSVALEVVGSGSLAVTALTVKEGLLSAVPVIDVSGTPSSDKSFEQVQTERLIGTWDFRPRTPFAVFPAL